MNARFHKLLAEIADLSLKQNANAANARKSTNVYATVTNSPEFTREQMAMLLRCEIWPFADETIERPTEMEVFGEQESPLSLVDVLGRYFSKERKVVLYTNVISFAAKSLRISKKILREVVLAHEIAHAVTHFGAEWNGRIWEKFAYASTEDKELLAQLLPHVLFRQNGMTEHLEVMQVLAMRQSHKYKAYTEYEDFSLAEIQRLVRDLRHKPFNQKSLEEDLMKDEVQTFLSSLCVKIGQSSFGWSSGDQATIVRGSGKVIVCDNTDGRGYLHPMLHDKEVEEVELPGRVSNETLKKIAEFISQSRLMFLKQDVSPIVTTGGATNYIQIEWIGEDRHFTALNGEWGKHQTLFERLQELVNQAKNEAS